MLNSRPYASLLLSCLIVFLCCGCSRLPPPPEKPDFSPGAAGKAAIAEYDTNGDKRLDAEELGKCPALERAMQRVDADGDGMLTAGEITDRLDTLLGAGSTVLSGTVLVEMDDEPLEEATVTFEPEKFLGDAIKPSSGVTDDRGEAHIKGSQENYPGICVGMYKVRISKKVNGRETIPARYNTQTELGYEAADDIPGVGLIEFLLESD